MKKIIIHKTDKKLEGAKKGLDRAEISEKNKQTVSKFLMQCKDEELSKDRLIKMIRYPVKLAKALKKDFNEVTKEDLKEFVRKINDDENYSVWTKHEWKVIIKKFFSWLEYGEEYRTLVKTEGYPKIINWIFTTIKAKDKPVLDRAKILVPEEVAQLINKADHPRNKALISLIYETGGRIGEVLSLRINQIEDTKEGMMITIKKSKTKQRIIPYITHSIPYVRMWLANHPFRDDPESPLWINRGNHNFTEAMEYDAVRMLLHRLTEKAGIKKKVTPHVLRRSRASYLANYMTEFQMNQYFGWNQGSDTAGSYVKLASRDLKKALFESNGRKLEDVKQQTKKCHVCNEENPPTARECVRCYAPLDTKSAIERTENLYKIVLNNPEAKEQLMKQFIEEAKEQLRKANLNI